MFVLVQLCIAKPTQVHYRGKEHFAEVRFYFRILRRNVAYTFVMASPYGDYHEQLYRDSSHALMRCKCPGEDDRLILPYSSIRSVVACIPVHEILGPQHQGFVFVAEKLGLDVAHLAGPLEDDEGDSDDV